MVTACISVIVSIKRLTIPGGTGIVVVCSDLSGKELHRQAGMGRVVISGSLGGVIVKTLIWNTRYVGSIPTLGVIFLILINPDDNIVEDFQH